MVALLVYLGYMHVYKDSDFGPIFVSVGLAGQLPQTPENDESGSLVSSVCRADVFVLVSRTL